MSSPESRNASERRRSLSWPVVLILLIGSMQILGFVTRFEALRNLGRVTAASPLPLVFSDFRGLETFSLDFTMVAETLEGQRIETRVTPSLYGQFPGPYNRRNVYGAVLAFGPKLSLESEKPLVDAVLNYAFCNQGPLSLMFDSGKKSQAKAIKRVEIHARSRAGKDGGVYSREVICP